jgi:hypothetical protein
MGADEGREKLGKPGGSPTLLQVASFGRSWCGEARDGEITAMRRVTAEMFESSA